MKNTKKPTILPIASLVAMDKTLIEMVHDHRAHTTAFIQSKGDAWRKVSAYRQGDVKYIPFPPDNNLLRHKVILFPEHPQAYGSTEQLIADIRQYLHSYVDLSESFALITSYYILFSWVFDRFNELPYLRVRGNYGTGKTRFLLIAGALCYKPIFASGASTVSPLFHIMSSFGGTLVIDEADFRYSDEMALMTKILNNGNVKGIPVLRSELDAKKSINPRAFTVYGPKIVATRGHYQDKALESRFITEEMGQRPLRKDIPINLPDVYQTEAQVLRNKLLRFRFEQYYSVTTQVHDLSGLAPRIQQLFTPLLSVISDPAVRKIIISVAEQNHAAMQLDQAQPIEIPTLRAIRTLATTSPQGNISMKAIAEAVNKHSGSIIERPITPKWIGSVVRQKLRLVTHKSNGVFVLDTRHNRRLTSLYQRYGIDT